ncbi:MAG: sigma-54-dependent Fis family transcriptional regulator [Polyangiales bacterium]
MSEDELRALTAERDLYARLLELSGHSQAESFLDEALSLVAETCGARSGYLALGASDARSEPPIAMIRGFSQDEVSSIRERLSHGIIAEALRTGRTIATASAMEDPRFSSNASVRAAKIEAVLCAPIGGDARVGVLYLQGRERPGPFTERDRAMAELFAKHVAATAQRLLEARRANAREDHTAELRAKLQVESLAGTSRAMASMLQRMSVAALVDVTVLVTGESGTGKTEVARALHASSPRAAKPFVAVNCAAIPEALFESELFGAEKGAHSTATRRISGKVDAAQGGTLFLDEVAELPLTVQAKLLQFLQSRTYFRLGSSEALTADVRLIAATNADLQEMVRAKRFREDLYYRLEVFTIRVPSLRERPEDVSAICDFVLAELSRSMGRTLALTWAARASLVRSEWPGNVRQLASTLQRAAAFALGDGTDTIDVRHVFADRADAQRAAVTAQEPAAESLPWEEATRRFQRELLARTLDATKWNITETARRLGLARSHLYELLRAHGLSRSRS